jgi:hypothetical protein
LWWLVVLVMKMNLATLPRLPSVRGACRTLEIGGRRTERLNFRAARSLEDHGHAHEVQQFERGRQAHVWPLSALELGNEARADTAAAGEFVATQL